MIKCDTNGFHAEGTLEEIEGDLVTILHVVKEKILIPQLGPEQADTEMNMILELSKKPEEEVKAQAKSIMHNIFEDMFKDMFGGK